MKCSEFIRKIKKAGWRLQRQGKGSHEIWHHPEQPGNELIVPNHGSQEMGRLADALLKKAGLK